jgi:putative transposase
LGVQTLFIEPGSPWENGYNESFNGKLRAIAVEWRNLYNFAGS